MIYLYIGETGVHIGKGVVITNKQCPKNNNISFYFQKNNNVQRVIKND